MIPLIFYSTSCTNNDLVLKVNRMKMVLMCLVIEIKNLIMKLKNGRIYIYIYI